MWFRSSRAMKSSAFSSAFENCGACQQQALDRQGVDAAREDPACAERLDQRDPVAVLVLRRDVDVGGDERAQVAAERDVVGRRVVERANADVQQVLGNLGGFTGEAPDQVAADAALGQHTGPVGGDPQQVPGAERVNPLEGIEDRRDQHGAAIVRLDGVDVVGRRSASADASFPRASLAANHVAQGAAVAAQRFAELRRQLAEHERLLIHPPAGGIEAVLDEGAGT